jgi:hypothetical protein
MMYTTKTPTLANNMWRRVSALAAIGTVGMALAAAGPAQADPKSGTGTAKGCPVENNGTLGTVAVGTRIGLFVCGEDGEWHFGWLITGISAPHKSKVRPIGAGAVRVGTSLKALR